MIYNAGYMGAKPPLFSMDSLKGLLSGAGQKLEDGAKTIFSNEQVVQGWQDVFDGLKGSVASDAGAAAGQAAAAAGSAVASTAGAAASTAGAAAAGGASAGAASAVASSPLSDFGSWLSHLFGFTPSAASDGASAAASAAKSVASVVPSVAPAPLSSAIGGPEEINIGLKWSQPALSQEVTTIKIVRNPVLPTPQPVPAAGGAAVAPASSASGAASDAGSAAVKADDATTTASGAAKAGAAGDLKEGLSKIAGGMLDAAKNGALFSGVISTVVNGFEVLTGQEKLGDGVGGVAADTADGAVSGAAGAAISGLAIAGATALGLTAGLPLTILGIVGGLGGALLGDRLFKGSGIYDGIKSFVSKLFGG